MSNPQAICFIIIIIIWIIIQNSLTGSKWWNLRQQTQDGQQVVSHKNIHMTTHSINLYDIRLIKQLFDIMICHAKWFSICWYLLLNHWCLLNWIFIILICQHSSYLWFHTWPFILEHRPWWRREWQPDCLAILCMYNTKIKPKSLNFEIVHMQTSIT